MPLVALLEICNEVRIKNWMCPLLIKVSEGWIIIQWAFIITLKRETGWEKWVQGKTFISNDKTTGADKAF